MSFRVLSFIVIALLTLMYGVLFLVASHQLTMEEELKRNIPPIPHNLPVRLP